MQRVMKGSANQCRRRARRQTIFLYALVVVCAMAVAMGCGGGGGGGGGSNADESPQRRAEAWRADIDFLAARMRAIHPNLFHALPEEDFDRAVNALKADIPNLTDHEVIVAIMELVAMPAMERDGHMQVSLFGHTGFRMYPLRLYVFSDGVFVINASEPYQQAIGARLVRIGDSDIALVSQLLDPLITRDNAMTARLYITTLYVVPELLQTLGIIDDPEQGRYVFEDESGAEFTLLLAPIDHDRYTTVIGGSIALPEQPEPLYLSNLHELYWLQLLDDNRTLFIKYNQVQATTQSGESISAFSNRIASLVVRHQVEKVVLDMRTNIGGNHATYDPLLAVLSSGAINQPGKLYTLIGRLTFSAGGNFVTDMERRTHTLFVGEPTGSSPNQYGDNAFFTLPHSRLEVGVPTRYWQLSNTDDTRLSHAPDIAVDVSSTDYFTHRDPVLETVLSATSVP